MVLAAKECADTLLLHCTKDKEIFSLSIKEKPTYVYDLKN